MDSEKIGSREEIAVRLASIRGVGPIVGFTSGSFDLLHRGHVEYLEKARALCDRLVVGVNTDRSVKSYKGLLRPIISEGDRARVVAALGAVSDVFLFDERNNNKNIEVLRPDLYIKAADYSTGTLSSAPLVEAYGGRIELIPFTEGRSTTSIIERVEHIARAGDVLPSVYEPKPALFLDRDGTIIEHCEYLHDPNRVTFLQEAFEGIKAFKEAGYRVVMVTNQPGIGLGYFDVEDLFRVNARIMKEASRQGVLFDKLYFCPHSQSDGCCCRKPGTGMLERAVRELNVIRGSSVMIGDMTSDVEVGRRFGCRAFLVETGQHGKDKRFEVAPDLRVSSILDAARKVL